MIYTQQMFLDAIRAEPQNPELRRKYARWLKRRGLNEKARVQLDFAKGGCVLPKHPSVAPSEGIKMGTAWQGQVLGALKKSGTREVLRKFNFRNTYTTQGLNHAGDVVLNGGTQVATWYVMLVDNSGFSAFAAADTPSSHAGWTELTGYSESVRQTWNVEPASGGVSLTTSVITFTASGTIAVKGGAIISVNTKGATTGTLLATAAFGAVQNLVIGQALQFTITNTNTSS